MVYIRARSYVTSSEWLPGAVWNYSALLESVLDYDFKSGLLWVLFLLFSVLLPEIPPLY